MDNVTDLNSYELSRSWFDWCFENPEKINPNHAALFFFAIEHCNRLGWKVKFGLPTSMAKEAIGIKSYATYSKTLNDLVDWGFIKMVERSKNQYSSNIIALSKNEKANVKALDKALIKHNNKQIESKDQSTNSIDKQYNKEQSNNKQINKDAPNEFDFLEYCKSVLKEKYAPLEFSLKAKYTQWAEDGWIDGNKKKISNWKTKILNTIPFLKPTHDTAKKNIGDRIQPGGFGNL